MIHQPSGGAQGQATDIEIQAREILSLRARLNDIYVQHTGQKLAAVEEALERDTYLSPEDSLKFGLIDQVVDKRPLLDDDDNDQQSSQDGNDTSDDK
jgi:ATP-dependent Clp protease protease subunit